MSELTTRCCLRVALPLPLPHGFDYWPAEGMSADADWLGCRVRVPFGNRELVGIVVELAAAPAEPDLRARLRPALARLDTVPLLGSELTASLRWASSYYQRPLGEVLNHALPAHLREGQPLPESGVPGWQLSSTADPASLRAGSGPRRLAEWLASEGSVTESRLADHEPRWRDAMRRLASRGWVEPVRIAASRPHRMARAAPQPTAEQSAALEALEGSPGFRAWLLDGVTGSGKTEVYLRAIEGCLQRGQQALVLVPEIGLTPQTLRRFRERLPVEVVASHSGMTDGERLRAWAAMSRGEARVLVGTRSAVFTPLPEAGLIVIDEEHDGSYKQQDGFRYHARDLALVRARALDVPVILGSATPSLESLQHARSGRYGWLRLRQRAGGAQTPTVRVIDLRRQRVEDGLSRPLRDAIATHLQRGGQVLVFRNRRGFAPVLLCHDCGWTARCRHCESPLTVHAGGGRLICHHCGARQSAPLACPDCASLGLQPQGAGTERLEQALASHFPEVPLIRVDRETTRGRDALAAHFERLGDAPGILVGTQMLAKGHDLPRLTLVAVVGVDEGLFSADFRASEHLAQLLIQVAGRAGRADRSGEVVLQTHHPEHPLLTTLLGGGYPAFAEAALAEREAAALPPFGHLALLRAEAPLQRTVDDFLRAARDEAPRAAAITVHGPLPAPMPRRQGRLRGQLLLSSTHRGTLQAMLRAWTPRLYALDASKKLRWSLDIDPRDLF